MALYEAAVEKRARINTIKGKLAAAKPQVNRNSVTEKTAYFATLSKCFEDSHFMTAIVQEPEQARIFFKDFIRTVPNNEFVDVLYTFLRNPIFRDVFTSNVDAALGAVVGELKKRPEYWAKDKSKQYARMEVMMGLIADSEMDPILFDFKTESGAGALKEVLGWHGSKIDKTLHAKRLDTFFRMLDNPTLGNALFGVIKDGGQDLGFGHLFNTVGVNKVLQDNGGTNFDRMALFYSGSDPKHQRFITLLDLPDRGGMSRIVVQSSLLNGHAGRLAANFNETSLNYNARDREDALEVLRIAGLFKDFCAVARSNKLRAASQYDPVQGAKAYKAMVALTKR